MPAISSIRRAFPGSHISLLVKPWVSELFKENPDINEIILYEDRYRGFRGRLRLAKTLRQKNFDIALLLQNAFDAALVTWLAGIPLRIGYKRDKRGFLLTQGIPVERDVLTRHQVYYYLNLLRAAGIKTADPHPHLFLTDSERQWARDLLSSYFPADGRPLIGINPGATYGSAKRWPSDRFAALVLKIISELKGRIVIFGSREEVEIANEIVALLMTQSTVDGPAITNSKQHMAVMSGKTDLRELAALIAECDAFITNDSGPMHMASALHVPTVAIFGSTNTTTTGPFGGGHRIVSKNLSCAPCMKRECPEGHLNCMMTMTADEVFDALREILPTSRAVFLDKDGTIIEDKNYLASFDDLVILPRAKAALKRLKKAGFILIGITNQSGIARGIVDENFVRESNRFLQKELSIDDFYYCPHHPDEHCPCRKPEPLLLLRAAVEHKIMPGSSYVIGDKESDVLLAKKAGASGILLSPTPLFENTCASYIAKDLDDAVTWILEKEG